MSHCKCMAERGGRSPPIGARFARAGGGWGLAVVAAGAAGACERIPEVEALHPVFARPPDRIEVRELAPGTNLGQALWSAGVGAGEHRALLAAFGEQADARRLRPGTRVSARWTRAPERLVGVEVWTGPDTTVLIEPAEGGEGRWSSWTRVTALAVDTVVAAGRIESSLWSAVVGLPDLADIPDRERLVWRLDQAFQWRIDFSRQLRAGDTFRFAFELNRRPDGSTHSGTLLAAELSVSGSALHALWFAPTGDEQGGWYDMEGESTRRAFLKKPLRLAYISSRFQSRRFHPVLRTWRAHQGVDYAARQGSPIEATAKGVVVRRGVSRSYGRVIDLRHANGYRTRYAHMSRWAKGTAVGSAVAQGQVIGYVGMTGLATGPHLHYELHRGGHPVDPLNVDLPAGDPVPDGDRERWERERDDRLAILPPRPGPRPARARLADASQ